MIPQWSEINQTGRTWFGGLLLLALSMVASELIIGELPLAVNLAFGLAGLALGVMTWTGLESGMFTDEDEEL